LGPLAGMLRSFFRSQCARRPCALIGALFVGAFMAVTSAERAAANDTGTTKASPSLHFRYWLLLPFRPAVLTPGPAAPRCPSSQHPLDHALHDAPPFCGAGLLAIVSKLSLGEGRRHAAPVQAPNGVIRSSDYSARRDSHRQVICWCGQGRYSRDPDRQREEDALDHASRRHSGEGAILRRGSLLPNSS
jgi:hypothetical protein